MTIRLFAAAVICAFAGAVVFAQQNGDSHKLAHDIFKELIETNTTESVGDMMTAANEMAERLRAAGFPASDIVVLGPDARHGNIVARIHGTGAHKPVHVRPLVAGAVGGDCPPGAVEMRRADPGP